MELESRRFVELFNDKQYIFVLLNVHSSNWKLTALNGYHKCAEGSLSISICYF